MRIANGTRVGPYEIVGWLGAGGMGEVYRARDARLARDVALKLMPAAFAADAGRLHRFEQEARAAGQLNHPNILAVYDVGTHEGAPYIVSELLDGDSLGARLAGGALAARKALDYARQIAEGLAAAHAKGIVHRDLKPDNLFITIDGRVKILDFGIAKLSQPGADQARHTALPTETEVGVVVGTPSYMSPEQVRGEVVDPRSDIFSFGAVLYEMLAGRPAFTRGTPAETMAAILKEDPPDPSPAIAPALARIASHCLEKAREARFQSARDLAFGLESLVLTTAAAPAVGAPARRTGWVRTAAALGVAALVLALGWTLWQGRTPDATTQVLSIVPPQGVVFAAEEAPVISPDGRRVAFVAHAAAGRRLLYTRALDLQALGPATVPQPVADSDGASLPFWSPDSQSIGFFAQGKLKRADLATGRVRTLADAGGARGGTWSQDDVIVFVPHPPAGPYRVSAEGGDQRPVAIDGPPAVRWFPSFLPDGRSFLFFDFAPGHPENAAVSVASLDGGQPTQLFYSQSNAIYAAPGYLIFWREGALLAQPFDARTRQLEGSAVPVTTDVGLHPLTGQLLVSASDSGTLVFFGGAIGETQLTWVDRAGTRIGTPGAPRTHNSLALSPDGGRVVFDAADLDTVTSDLWLLDFARGDPFKLTFHAGHDLFPIWSPDGRRVAFSSLRDGRPSLYELRVDSPGDEQPLLRSDLPNTPSDWSGDGRLLIYTVTDPKTSGDIWALPLPPAGAPAPFAVVATPADERYGVLSPDGRWLAYVSNAGGAYEVFVQAFPTPGGRRQVSTNSGFEPSWRRDGKELFYLGRDQQLMSVAVTSDAAKFDPAPPQALFSTRTKLLEIQGVARHYAAAADGQRFLISTATTESQSAGITVVLNWQGALRR